MESKPESFRPNAILAAAALRVHGGTPQWTPDPGKEVFTCGGMGYGVKTFFGRVRLQVGAAVQAVNVRSPPVLFKKLEHGCRMIHADFPSLLSLGLELRHVPTLWLLLYE